MSVNKEKVQEAYDRWSKQKTRVNMSALLRELDPMIKAVASTHGARGDENVSWAAKAYLARQLMERYDPEKSSLSTFTYQTLQRLPRIVAQQKNVVPIPESSDTDLRYLRGVESDLMDVLGRNPTHAELADKSGVSMDRVKSIRTRYSKPIIPASYLQQLAGSNTPGTAHEVDENPEEALWREYSVEALDHTDRKIYDWLNRPKPLSKIEIATKLGISPSAVTQRSTRIGKEFGAYEI